MGGLLWADAGGETVGAWAGVVATVANLGFAGVVAWFLLTKALPKMQREFADALSRQRDSFLESLDRQHASFGEREKERREDGKAALTTVVAHCERESARHAEVVKVEMGLVTAAMRDQREVLEEVRDVLRVAGGRGRRPQPGPSPQNPPRPGGGGATS